MIRKEHTDINHIFMRVLVTDKSTYHTNYHNFYYRKDENYGSLRTVLLCHTTINLNSAYASRTPKIKKFKKSHTIKLQWVRILSMFSLLKLTLKSLHIL